MKYSLLLTLFIAAFVLFSCNPDVSAPGTGGATGSGEAAIRSIEFDGINLTVDDIELNTELKTIYITLPPVNLSALAPDVTVSEYATYTGFPSPIPDGTQFNVTVTAENGFEAVWKVTVSVKPGMSYRVNGGQRIILGEGIYNSENEEVTARYGGNTPMVYLQPQGEDLEYTALETGQDILESRPFLGYFSRYEGIFIQMNSPSGNNDIAFNISFFDDGIQVEGNGISIIGGEQPPEDYSDESYFKGTFYGTDVQNIDRSISDGYFKLLWIEYPMVIGTAQ